MVIKTDLMTRAKCSCNLNCYWLGIIGHMTSYLGPDWLQCMVLIICHERSFRLFCYSKLSWNDVDLMLCLSDTEKFCNQCFCITGRIEL